MKKILFYFALTGWTLALIIHLISLVGIDLTEKISFIWILHIGIFIVCIPAGFDLKKNQELKDYQHSSILNRMNPIGYFKIIFKDTPTWIAIIAICGFFYAFINFSSFIASQDGTPDIKDGQFVLLNHGQLIKTLTKQEFHHYKANEVRGFSGHWILFYGLATALLYKFSGLIKKKETAQL